VQPRRSRAWIGYFVALVVLGCVALLAPVIYNLSIQLTPDQLATARQRWAQHGPRDYDLDYSVKRYPDPRPDVYHVEVRGGQAVRVLCNRQAQLLADPATGLLLGAVAGVFREDDSHRQTVEGIFDHLHGLVTRTTGRAAPSRDYCTASFDPTDGHPLHFIHRVAGAYQRQEWTIQLTPR
jgi:hypothetical protein